VGVEMTIGVDVLDEAGMADPGLPQFVAVEDEEGLPALPVLEFLRGSGPAGVGSFVTVRNAYGVRRKLTNRGFRWNPATKDWRKPCGGRSDLEALVRDAFSAGVRFVERRSAAAVRKVAPDLFAK
jgi:hypothetical protein